MHDLSDICNQKRQTFRQQIRRKQIDSLFAERRKAIMLSYAQYQQAYVPANQDLMRRSLWKDELLSQLPTLLPALHNKIKNNREISNIQFVISLSSNILRDSITVQQTQYIYNYCINALKMCAKNISPLVEVYFYETVMGACYSKVDEFKQAEIEECILPRLAALMINRDADMSRICEGVSKDACREGILEGVLAAFFYFYQPERDHNQVLIYKAKRTKAYIQAIIEWWHQQSSSLSSLTNYKQLVQHFITMFVHISQISLSMAMIISIDRLRELAQILMMQLSMQSQNLSFAKTLSLKVFQNLLNDDELDIQYELGEKFMKIILYQLEISVDSEELIELAKVLNLIVSKQQLQKPQYLRDVDGSNIVLLAKDIISRDQQHTDPKLLTQCLKLVRNVLILGFEQGNSEYSSTLAHIGGIRMIDSLYVLIKNQQVLELIETIYHYADLC